MEDDVNHFRHETALLAQHYMVLHPELVKAFVQETVHPITALYCMPGLCSVDVIILFGTVAEIKNRSKKAHKCCRIVSIMQYQ
jgi:hypothetical protein